ncbi:hypothetical protein JST97_32295 [bacterium]|nr:hypothetical protein [bacterium]
MTARSVRLLDVETPGGLDSLTVHFLPIFLIPVLIWVGLNARRWGLFSDVPVDSEARVAYWGSQALAQLKLELVTASLLQIQDQRLLYRSGGKERNLWSQGGKLCKQSASQSVEVLAELGQQGTVTFAREGDCLQITILAKDGEFSRRLEASLPWARGGGPPE